MPNISNFNAGFEQGVTIRNLPIANTYSGQLLWVDSNSPTPSGYGTFLRPFATLAGALSWGSLNNNGGADTIYIKAGHVETITAAGTITISKTNLNIIGMGTGADRPVFNFTTATTASVLITGAGTTLKNIIGKASINALVNPFNVQAAGCTLDIEWQDSSTVLEANRAILTSAAATKICINLRYMGQTGGSSCVNAIRLVGASEADINVHCYGKASTAWVEFATTACAGVRLRGYVYNSGTTNGTKNVIDTITGSTWYAYLDDGSSVIGSPLAGGSGVAIGPVLSSTSGEYVATSATAVMVNANTLFTIAGGPINILSLVSECVTGNDATASTLQYNAVPTIGSATTISGASASLASALAGSSVTLSGTALATAALLSGTGPNLIANPGTIYVPAGTIKATIAIGSTTGTWRHRIRYKPLAAGVTVS